MIVNLDSGDYYSLSQVGVDCWNCLSSGYSIDETIASVAAKYEGSLEDMRTSITDLFSELEAEALIVRTSDGAPTRPTEANPAGNGERRAFVTPVLNRYSDMRDLLLIDPIHEVDDTGWPETKKDEDEPSTD